jgi:hypothetical protein
VTSRNSVALTLFAILVATVSAQQSKPAGILASDELRKIAPSGFFYRGQSASTQLRNTAGIHTENDKYILAGMVDTSGYASSVAERYQGFLITEVKLRIEGSELTPGQYGFGFAGDKFVVTDVGANEVLSLDSKKDDNLKRAVPLKIVKEGEGYRLYAGKKYVGFEPE